MAETKNDIGSFHLQADARLLIGIADHVSQELLLARVWVDVDIAALVWIADFVDFEELVGTLVHVNRLGSAAIVWDVLAAKHRRKAGL